MAKESHVWGGAFFCIFDPGILVRMADGHGTVDALYCFSCDEMSLCKPGKPIKKQAFSQLGRERFLALFKPLFPRDSAFQKIPRVREH